MKMTTIGSLRRLALSALAAAVLSLPARAVPLVTLDPVTQNIPVGGTAVVNLNISGLGAGVTPTLGAWLAYIASNSSIVGFASATYGTNLDLGVLGTLQFTDSSTPGLLKMDETSFEDTTALNSAQPAAFTLATLSFTGLAPGTSALTFNRLELSDEIGFPLAYTSTTASITVGTPGVPEGGSLHAALALCVGLVLLVHSLRRRSSGRLALL